MRFREARKAGGDDFNLAVDANQGYTIAQAITFAKLVDDLNVMWFEEPVHLAERQGGDARCPLRRQHRASAPDRASSPRPAAGTSMETGSIDFCNFDSSWSWRPHRVAPGGERRERLRREDGAPRGAAGRGAPAGVDPAWTFLEYFHPQRDPIWHNVIANRPELKDGYIHLPQGSGARLGAGPRLHREAQGHVRPHCLEPTPTQRGVPMARQPIIDTHVHFSDFGQTEYDLKWVWLEPDFVHPILGDIGGIKARKYTIDELWGEARFADVSGFVHVQAALGSADPVEETRWLTAMRKDAPAPFTIVGHADLGTADGIPQLEGHLESPYFVGIRDFVERADVRRARGEPGVRGVPEVHDRAQRHVRPRLRVAEHGRGAGARAGATPGARGGARAHRVPAGARRRVLRQLAALAARARRRAERHREDLGPRHDRPAVHARTRSRRWVDGCVEAFGPDRAVLGSNWPVDRLYSSYDVILDLYRDYISALSDAEQAKILNGNANRIYRVL